MTEMRKAKEEELFKAFQTHQARIRDMLQAESAKASSDEDKRIAQAVVEQEEKKLVHNYTDCVFPIGPRKCTLCVDTAIQ